MSYDWEGNRRSSVALTMRHKLIRPRLSKEDERLSDIHRGVRQSVTNKRRSSVCFELTTLSVDGGVTSTIDRRLLITLNVQLSV